MSILLVLEGNQHGSILCVCSNCCENLPLCLTTLLLQRLMPHTRSLPQTHHGRPSQNPHPLFHIMEAPFNVQVLVDKNECGDEAALAELGPGALLSVSQVAGRG